MTALGIACEKGFAEVVNILIGAGANLECAKDDVSALVLAARNGFATIVDALIKAGANVNSEMKVCLL